jgi:hypothetical protein
LARNFIHFSVTIAQNMSMNYFSAFITAMVVLEDYNRSAGTAYLKYFRCIILHDPNPENIPLNFSSEALNTQILMALEIQGVEPQVGSLCHITGTFSDEPADLLIDHYTLLWNEFAGDPSSAAFVEWGPKLALAQVNLTGVVVPQPKGVRAEINGWRSFDVRSSSYVRSKSERRTFTTRWFFPNSNKRWAKTSVPSPGTTLHLMGELLGRLAQTDGNGSNMLLAIRTVSLDYIGIRVDVNSESPGTDAPSQPSTPQKLAWGQQSWASKINTPRSFTANAQAGPSRVQAGSSRSGSNRPENTFRDLHVAPVPPARLTSIPRDVAHSVEDEEDLISDDNSSETIYNDAVGEPTTAGPSSVAPTGSTEGSNQRASKKNKSKGRAVPVNESVTAPSTSGALPNSSNESVEHEATRTSRKRTRSGENESDNLDSEDFNDVRRSARAPRPNKRFRDS